MAITPHPLTIIAQNFNDALHKFLAKVEGDIPFVYSDSKGIPTLGIGYALVVKGVDGIWQLRAEYQTELSAAGISLTPAQLLDLSAKLIQAMNALNGTGDTNPFSPAASNINPLGWTINSTQSKSLFNYVVPEYETRVRNWLGNDTLYNSLQGSMEMVALFSLAYQGFINTGSSPALKRAIVNDDRAEAWYEIRYNTSVEARRFLEADTFGLYNDKAALETANRTAENDADAKGAYRMLVRHRAKILGGDGAGGTADDYDMVNQSRLNTAISWGTALGTSVSGVQEQLSLARNYLAYHFITAEGIQGAEQVNWDHIYVGEDESSLYGNYRNPNDTGAHALVGSNSNDLIFGESGLDVLEGKGGDDVLHGGLGFDTYIFRAGESFPGHDYVIDPDGGQLFYYTSDGTLVLLSGGERETTGPAGIWTQEVADGTVQYVQSGNDLDITTPDGGVITVQDYFLGTLAMNIGLSGSTIQGLNNVRAMGITLLTQAEAQGATLQGTENNDGDLTFLPAANLAGGGLIDTLEWNVKGNSYGPLVVSNRYSLQEVLAGAPDTMELYAHDLTETYNAIYGLGGNDWIVGTMTGVGTLLDGGDGNDHLWADASLAPHTTGFTFGSEQELIEEAARRVSFYSTPGPGTTLAGGAGHDALIGGQFSDLIDAGSGHDFIVADPSARGDLLAFVNPLGFVEHRAVQYPAGVGNDYIDGGSGNDWIDAGGNADVLRGGPETSPNETDHDQLLGGAGDDQLLGGAGDDWLYGDTFGSIVGVGAVVTGYSGPYPVNYTFADLAKLDYYLDYLGWDGAAQQFSIPEYHYSHRWMDESLVPIPRAFFYDVPVAEQGNDLLDGGTGNDALFAGGGNDILDGGADQDHLYGEAGDDALFGGDGDDILYGDLDERIVARDGQVSSTFGFMVYYTRKYADGFDIAGSDYLDGGAGSDTLLGGGGTDVLEGGLGDDILFGEDGDDRLSGGDGVDQLVGGSGADILEGGLGDDILFADAEDRIVWNPGDGNDIIIGQASADFADVSLDEAQVSTTTLNGAQNLTLSFDSGEMLTFEGGLLDDGQTYTFGGETVTQRELLARAGQAFTIIGGTGNDLIQGTEVAHRRNAYLNNPYTTGSVADDRLYGGDGQDTVYGYGGNDLLEGGNGNDTLDGGDGADNLRAQGGDDTLRGGAGNDALFGGDGADTLDGGAGSDILSGDAGGDTYLFGRGSGSDTIIESDQTGSSIDTVSLDAGILPADVSLHRNGDDLILALDTGASQLAVKNYFLVEPGRSASYYGIERIVFADGTIWTPTDVAARVQGGSANSMTGTAGNDSFVVDNVLDTIAEGLNGGVDTIQSSVVYTLPDNVENLMLTGFLNLSGTGNALDNVIHGNSGNNILDGGSGGWDTLIGGAGDDVYKLGGTYTDIVVENADEGTDWVWTSFNYILPANVENLAVNSSAWGNYTLTGNELDNLIIGSDLSATTLNGGAGADIMIGGENDDTFVVDNAGDVVIGMGGMDTVFSSGSYVLAEGLSRLYLTGSMSTSGTGNAASNTIAGVDNSAANILVGGMGDDLYLLGNGDTVIENPGEGVDTIQIEERESGSASPSYSLSSFANVESLTLGYWIGTANATGDDGDNRLTGNISDNVLGGGAGNDKLYGEAGNDILEGGMGADLLSGWTGADVYQFARGDGADEVLEANELGVVDAIEFSADVLPGDVAMYRLDNDLLLSIHGTTDLMRVTGFFATSATTIEEIRFASGAVWNRAYIDSHLASAAAASSGTDFLVGAGGDDAINALGGDDVVFGGMGNDLLDGGSGADLMFGGRGADTYVVDNVGDVVTESESEYGPSDTVRSSVSYTLGTDLENLVLIGSAAISGTGNAAANILDGSQNSAANVLTGGQGNDTYIVGDGDVVVEMAGQNSGIDTVETTFSHTLGSNIENLTLTGSAAVDGTGNALANILRGNSADNTLHGGVGNDGLYGGTGNDVLNGGTGGDYMQGDAGDDTYVVDVAGAGGDTVVEYANEGIDTVRSSVTYTLGAHVENLVLAGSNIADGNGNELNNSLIGNDAVNILRGNGGDDVLDGAAGADQLIGGAGNDTYIVDNAGDQILESANQGNDTVQSSVNLTLGAYVENLTLTGGAQNGTGNWIDNIITGNSANNILDGNTGADTMAGGSGSDTYVVDNAGDLVVEQANEGIDTVQSVVSFALGANIEHLTLTGTSAIAGTGNALDNVIDGSQNSAANVLTGGAGNDTYVLGAGDTVVENADEGTDTVRSASTYTLGANVENLILTGNAAINGTGNAGNNVLDGSQNGAANALTGGAGDDTYILGVGDTALEDVDGGMDTVQFAGSMALGANIENLTLLGSIGEFGTGNDLANAITGNDGNNRLTGGRGNDALAGGAGNDDYRFNLGDGRDVIADTSGDDLVVFGTGIINNRIAVNRDVDDLVLTLNSNDEIRITGWFTGNQIERFVFSDATTVTAAEMEARVGLPPAQNNVPVLSAPIADQAAQEAQAFSFAVPTNAFTDPDTGDVLSYGATLADGSALPSWLSFNAATRTFSGTPNTADIGTVEVRVTVTDTEGLSVSDDFVLSVAPTPLNSITGTAANETLTGTTGGDLIQGLGGNDNLYGRAGNDSLDGGAGADWIYGEDGSDTLLGGDGNDYLYGGNGNDILDGGAGNDSLSGDAGNDIFRFGRGGGQDTINAYDYTTGKLDTIVFTGDVLPGDVTAKRSNNNLILSINGTTDTLTVSNHFSSSAYEVGQIQFADGTVWNTATIRDKVLVPTEGADYLKGYETDDTLNGLGGNDSLYGEAGIDMLDGGTGNDTLYGGAGDDILTGGAGNDTMSGDVGNDIYRFARGDGQDTINNYDTTAGKTDAVEFTADILPTDVTVKRNYDNLVLSINGATDTLTITSYFNADAAGPYKIEQIRFANGTVWDVATVKAMVLAATEAADFIKGYGTDDVLNGLGGNDMLYGEGGNDTLDGGVGNDSVYGGAGNDILTGGAGNDTLSGDAGSDAYRFGRGGGQDTINNYDITAGKLDAIEFAADVLPTDVVAKRSYDSLILSISGTTDTLTVSNYFNANATGPYKVEQVRFVDGTVWDIAAVKSMVLVPTEGADYLKGYETNDTLNGLGGNDNLYGEAGNDTLDGGAGNDTLDGGAGNDIFRFGRGYGQDAINAYDTTAGKLDAVVFAADVLPADVTVKRTSDNLILGIAGSSDTLTVTNYFNSDASGNYKVEEIRFTDGTVWTPATVKTLALVASEGNDSLYGYATDDSIAGLGGNDYLYGRAGNDVLDGGAGMDRLYGDDGNDTLSGGIDADYLYGGNGSDILDGGLGNDVLTGDAGNDIFRFGLGTGQDTVNAYDATAGKLDRLEASADMLDLVFSKSGANLVVKIHGDTSSATVSNWTYGNAYQTQQFGSADGYQLLNTQVDQLIQAMATFSANNGGLTWDQAIDQRPNDVQAVLAAYWQPVP